MKKPYMTQQFHEGVQELIARQGHALTARLLFEMDIPFEDAYELIFNRVPRLV